MYIKGLATFKAARVTKASLIDNNELLVSIKGTPIDGEGNYIQTKPVFVDDKVLPMHADMLYSEPIIKGEPNSKHRAIANELLKIANYFPYPNINSDEWEGDLLCCKELKNKIV